MRLLLIATLVLAACSAEAESGAADDEGCAHVIGATAEDMGSSWTVTATVRSADTGWDKYADAWQVRGPDNELLGERVLAHPHENEQPFTRSLSGVEIPDGVDTVTVAARDSVLGFCGDVFTLELG
jgi:ABC-type glycerol-3-phosphate transport system substrate-binding protein